VDHPTKYLVTPRIALLLCCSFCFKFVSSFALNKRYMFWGSVFGKQLGCLFKRKHRMFRSLKQGGTRRGTLAGTGGQKGGKFGESTGPVDNVLSDTPLGGNRKCTEQGVPAQRTGCSSAVRLAVCYEANLVGRHARHVWLKTIQR
jgi:hypothetical protein